MRHGRSTIFKYTKAQRGLIFGLSGAHAAATLAVILVGHQAGILDKSILNGTIVLILITCIIASFATESAAKKIIVEDENNTEDLVKTTLNNNERILLPIADVKNLDKLLELSIYLKDKKGQAPISILTVVSNDDEAEVNIIKTKNKYEEYVKQASATETEVDVITTIDHNAASGITRVSREIMADFIVLRWSKRSGFTFGKLIGDNLDSILINSDKMVFVSHLEQPLVSHKRIVVAVPPLAEYEKGFKLWMSKVCQLAQELTTSIQFFCDKNTENAILDFVKEARLSADINVAIFNDWEDFLILSRKIRDNDLFILISARRGTSSHISALDTLPSKLEKHFALNNMLIIYPQQYDSIYVGDAYEGVNHEPISKGIEMIQRLG
ncbi:MAG: universal stress protein, partial [Chitinophagales bacterium]|nr:universal stress protein [Chitinophagales bacterium]